MNGITDFIEDKQVNWAFFAPSFARLLDPSTVRSLKTIVLGGEAPGKDNIERWSGRPGLELIVTYGPAESCIYCAKNSVSKGKKMADGSIGHSIGGMMWIADLGRPQRLAPIGSIGEIAVEGSILARGYLKDPEKTAKSFKPMPEDWSRSRSGRVYYTGDLGRVNSDGTISCLGRRDDQVKIRGQRVELADIEYHLRKDDLVHQALVLYPRVGACADKLIGVLSMSTNDRTNKPASAADIEMAQSEDWLHVAAVQQTLENKVPSYMVPSLWIVLDSIPLMVASQKVNRKIVNEWIKTMDKATYDEITSFSTDSIATMASPVADRLEEQIRDIWCSVLNAKPENVGSQTSFFRVGGDSISAMTVVSRCKKEGFQVSVQDLLKTKTLSEFCDRLRVSKSTTSDDLLELIGQDEPEGTSFALSPIQSWFMALAPYGENHFNQSHLLRLTQAVNFNALQTALLKIIQRHPMLRARFEVCSDGDWKQFISADIEGSLQCRSLSSVTMKQAAAYAFSAQAGLDIVSGPLMAADLYTMTDGTQALFITCHHLVVDLVSWRIILQELEDLLMTGKAEDHSAISFSAWTRLLNKEIESPTAPQENAFARAPHADMGFWSICNADNVVATVAEQSFELDAETTQLLLGSSNDAFNTEPLDLLLAAVSHSFNQVFRAFRGPVAIFNESHGREAWRPELDISSTVGWFTSMCPVVLTDHGEDVVRSVQEVKDFRRRFADQGLSFGSFAKNADSAVEVTFNYFGLFQQFERDDSLLNQMNWNTIMQPSDASPDVPRFSLFDISAGVENGTLKMNFAYCKKIKHESLVQQWVSACSEALRDIISVTSECQDDERQCLTLSDFPHLPATYDELSVMLSTTLPNAGVSISNVQDIYPCSPMQTALLMGQAVDKSLYAVRYVWEVVSKRTVQVSLDRLMKSWEQVVQSHPMLRTVFVQGLSSGDGKRAAVYHQVVLRNMKPDVSVCEDASRFPMGRPEDFLQSGAPHHLALCQDATGKLFVQLDISHSLVDGTSIMVIIDSMIKAYDGSRISSGDQECYANFVSYLRRQDTEESLNFWRTYLAGSEPCHFPNLRTQLQTDNEMVLSEASRALEYLDFNYPNPARLHSSCINSDTTTASVYKLAWGLVLQSYTGINSPCFGFLASGRDLPIDDIEGFVGPFINMLVCKVTLEEANDTVKSVLSTAHNDYANCLSHQVCSLAEILRSLQIPGGGRLFNTVMSLQRHLPPGEENSQVEFKTNHVEDPSEVSKLQKVAYILYGSSLTNCSLTSCSTLAIRLISLILASHIIPQ
jgi:non-ribosomal peptide synthase protein (TIGR01720 family)